jgi:hypothetical protein
VNTTFFPRAALSSAVMLTIGFLGCRPRDRVATSSSRENAVKALNAERICRSPTQSRDWGGILWDSAPRGGISSGTVPKAPRLPHDAVSGLEGEFDLTVISTDTGHGSAAHDTIVRGKLSLHSTPPAYRHPPNPAVEFPFYGASTVDLKRLGPVSLSYSPADSSARRPGVQASYGTADRQLDLTFGNAFTLEGSYFDSGVMFYVFSVDSSGFRGRWREGGLIFPPPQGYFCAWRIPKSG